MDRAVALAILFFLPAFAAAQDFTGKDRVRWVIDSTVDPANLLGHAFGAGFGTATDRPDSLGTHWTGFEKRYINNITTSVLGNAIEAGAGYAWGEDPRYVRAAAGTSFKGRFLHAASWTVLARNNDGSVTPAYARFISIPASNAISDAWRPGDGQGGRQLLERTALGFAAQCAGNEWHEFWPTLKKSVFRR